VQRHEIMSNRRVTVSLLELAPGAATPSQKEARDTLAIYLSAGHTQNFIAGQKPAAQKIATGEADFHNMGYTHATHNDGTAPLRVALVEFAEPQGKMNPLGTNSRFCNPGSKTACVSERNLFCTERVCVEDVTMAPGAITTRHSHTTDHMLVAVSDYELTDEVESKGTIVRTRKSGEVEYIPAGITHRLTNTGKAPARFTVILWR
jgi:quercetin dioxygenase-like cupin family protein